MLTEGYELIPALIAAAAGVFKSVQFVQEGQLGVKLRFGRALRDKGGVPRVVQPGFVLMIPFVETLHRHHVRQQTITLDPQDIMIKKGLIFRVSSVLMFRVKDVYRALFEIDDLDHSLDELAMGVLREVLAGKEYTELSDMEGIAEELLGKLEEKAEEWGVTFIQFKLTSCAPNQESASLVNMEAGVQMKIDALKKAAKDLQTAELASLSPHLAAALIGIPMVTTANPVISVK